MVGCHDEVMRRVVMLVAVMALAACGDAPVALTPETTAATSTSVPSSSPTSTPATTDAAAETTTTEPSSAPMWARECTEKIGAADVEPVESFASEEFGPLAPEPGLRIVYPIGEQAESWSVPVSSVMRVPGGTLVSLTSSGPDGSERVVAVVDDSGSVRWRRCFVEMYGSFGIVDTERGVVDLEMVPADGQGPRWWAFDLRTGESQVEPEDLGAELTAEATAAMAVRTDVGFIVDGGMPSSWLQRFDEDGALLWERPDLTALGGEGFQTEVTDDGIVLVRACVGSPRDDSATDWPPCPLALLGVDMTDGRTLWQRDGLNYPWLVAGHYAIVSRGQTEGDEASVLLDTRTGEVVPGGVSDSPSVFRTECCGGYEYNRVEASGAVAWTIATYVLNVWFPAAFPGSGATVDLFGPSGTPEIEAHVIGWTDTGTACAAVGCDQIAAALFGFEPGTTVELTCRWQSEGEWLDLDSPPVNVAIAPDGSGYVAEVCATDQMAQAVQVLTADGLESNVLTP